MALINTINKMKQRGMQDEDIATTLQEQGYSPEEVFNSISQSNVKPASPEMQDMQPSLPIQQTMQPQPIQPLTQEYEYPTQAQYPQEQYPAAQYQQEQYQQYPAYEQYLPSTSDTMTEIAEEIVEEKLRKFSKEISNLPEFKTDIDSKIKNISDRLKRIEGMIDQLQLAILKKISVYGQGLGELKSELEKTQESFSKVLNPTIDKIRKQPEESIENKPVEKKKSKIGVEHYLRR